jgi:hypothetical protein
MSSIKISLMLHYTYSACVVSYQLCFFCKNGRTRRYLRQNIPPKHSFETSALENLKYEIKMILRNKIMMCTFKAQ